VYVSASDVSSVTVTARARSTGGNCLVNVIEALQLAAQRQQAEARQKIAVGLLGGAALPIALGSSRS
jgi:hypothetical protein